MTHIFLTIVHNGDSLKSTKWLQMCSAHFEDVNSPFPPVPPSRFQFINKIRNPQPTVSHLQRYKTFPMVIWRCRHRTNNPCNTIHPWQLYDTSIFWSPQTQLFNLQKSLPTYPTTYDFLSILPLPATTANARIKYWYISLEITMLTARPPTPGRVGIMAYVTRFAV